MIDENDREKMIQELLDRTTLPREYAEEAVAIALGEGGDIQSTRPLTPEEHARIFPARTLEEALVLMDQRAREQERIKAGA